jgi:hypothetical protein
VWKGTCVVCAFILVFGANPSILVSAFFSKIWKRLHGDIEPLIETGDKLETIGEYAFCCGGYKFESCKCSF